jgi:hypothetical protein
MFSQIILAYVTMCFPWTSTYWLFRPTLPPYMSVDWGFSVIKIYCLSYFLWSMERCCYKEIREHLPLVQLMQVSRGS